MDIDQLDQNAAVNKAGAILGNFQKAAKGKTADLVSENALQPYDEVRLPSMLVFKQLLSCMLGWSRCGKGCFCPCYCADGSSVHLILLGLQNCA